MRYKLIWTENKNADWKIVTAEGLDGTKVTDASINRVSKKGEVFPNFDEIKPGMEIEAEPWTAPSGKQYLFPPKVQGQPQTRAQGLARGSQAIAKAQDTKAANIEKAQENRSESVKIASTMRMAVDLVIAEKGNEVVTLEYLQTGIKSWREWLWKTWDETDQLSPF